jgi:hypothetical protein
MTTSAIVKAAEKDLPTLSPITGPPLKHYIFIFDAAGRKPPGSTDETGVKSVDVCNSKT